MGSPHYMSPEQIRSTRDVDARADLWSLGVVLFELITGSVPFSATELTPLISEILHAPHRRLRTVQPDAPEALEAVVDRCLSKDPEGRFQSAADLAMALIPFAPKHARSIAEKVAEVARSSGGVRIGREDSLPPPAPLSPPPSRPLPMVSPFPAAAQTSPSLTVSARPESPSRRLPIVASVFALLLLGGAISFALVTATPAASERPPPVPAATVIVTATAAVTAATIDEPPPLPRAAAAADAAAASAEAIPTTTTTTTRGPATTLKTPRAPTARPSSAGADASPVVGQEIRRER
jgi:eukaryotic-like serine/threonine-protein kinase